MAFATSNSIAMSKPPLQEGRVENTLRKGQVAQPQPKHVIHNVSTATHIVRLKVVGLAGIHFNKKNIRNVGTRRAYPCPAEEMKAVVAVARGQQIIATTALSRRLTTPRLTNQKVASITSQRRLALWSSERSVAVGSVIEFEATLDKLDTGDYHHSSSQYVPKSFEVIAALTEATEHERKVAIPIGVANLPIGGHTTKEITYMDLPILSLKQAKPMGDDKNGLKGFQMMSIHDKHCRHDPKAKKKSFAKLLGRGGSESHQKIPSVADRKMFSSVYSTDPRGDAVLRVEIQVIEKTSLHELVSKQPVPPPKIKKVTIAPEHAVLKESASDETAPSGTVQLAESPLLEPEKDPAIHSKPSECTQSTDSICTASMASEGSVEILGQQPQAPKYSTSLTADEEPVSEAASQFQRTGDDDDESQKDNAAMYVPPTTFSNQGGFMKSGYFQGFSLPSCGLSSYPDDLTMVTGEFFGRELRFPMCSALKKRLDDEDTFVPQIGEGSATVSDRRTSPTRTTFIQNLLHSSQSIDLQDRVSRAIARAETTLGRRKSTSKSDLPERNESKSNSTLEELFSRGATNSEKPDSAKDADGVNHGNSPSNIHSSPRHKDHIMAADLNPLQFSIATMLSCSRGSDVQEEGAETKLRPATKARVPSNLEFPEEPNSDDLTEITPQEFHREERKRRESRRRDEGHTFPLPYAFGGSGMCSNIHLVNDDEVYRELRSTRTTSSRSTMNISQITEAASVEEHYFRDYDHYSMERPRSRLSAPSHHKNG